MFPYKVVGEGGVFPVLFAGKRNATEFFLVEILFLNLQKIYNSIS